MTFSAFRIALAMVAGFSLLLAGCGGGGASTSSPGSKISSAINGDNSKDVGAQAYWVIKTLNSQISISTSSISNATAPLPANSCVTRTIDNDASSNTITITFAYKDCAQIFTKQNGTMTIKLSDFGVKNPLADNQWKGTITTTFDITTVDTADLGISSQLNAELTINYTQTAPQVGFFDASANSWNLRTLLENVTISERNLSGFTSSGSTDSTNLNTFKAGFVLTGLVSKLGNLNYTVETPTDFKQLVSNDGTFGNPTQGKMIVTATDNSSLTLTAASDSSTVQLDVSRDGGNTIDDHKTTTWTELGSLALSL